MDLTSLTPIPGRATPELIAAVATATAECTALMNEQFLALLANDPEIARFDESIAMAILKRKRAMEGLLAHIGVNNW
jgi:hypothetical protein